MASNNDFKLKVGDKQTIVDREIYKIFKWQKDCSLFLINKEYAAFYENGKTIQLHRFVYKHFNPDFDIDDISIQIDHKNRNPLNNTIDNLRIATTQQNCLNKEKYSNNTSGIKCIGFSNSKNKWYFRITLTNRKYDKYCYNSKEEAYFALKYLVDKVATEEEKEFIYIEDFETNLTEEQKNNIIAGIDEYLEKTKANEFKEIIIKKPATFINKNSNKYVIKITIFNKRYCFGSYNTVEQAKPYRDFLVDMFNNVNEENYSNYEKEIKNKFNDLIQQNIYKIINKKLNN